MSNRIACYTLFDITRTGVLNRARPGDDIEDTSVWYRQRNTQCNFDTILQVISLRAQPDVITEPKKMEVNFSKKHNFGKDYNVGIVPFWTFDFDVHHHAVFEDGISELGALYKDCENVPMVKCDTHWNSLGNSLDVSQEKRNIYFVKY